MRVVNDFDISGVGLRAFGLVRGEYGTEGPETDCPKGEGRGEGT